MAQKTVPVLDLAKWTDGSTEQKSQFVAELGDAFHEIGFIAIKNHGIPTVSYTHLTLPTKA